jgi:hypothetical protein
MPRFKHYLTENIGSRRPARLVFLDCDSTTEELTGGDVQEHFAAAYVRAIRRRKGYYQASDETRRFDSAAACWDYIEQQSGARTRVLVCSANPVRVLTLMDNCVELPARGWALETPTSSARFTAIAWKKQKRRLLFIAHGNIFPMHRLCETNATLRVEDMANTWLRYLALLDRIDAGDFHLSLGAQASSIYRHRFMMHPILLHCNKDADELETRATFGGIYQPYFYGTAPPGTYFYLDTNSMYPGVMRSKPLPWRLVSFTGMLPLGTLSDKLRTNAVIATVYLITDDPHYPVRVDNRTVYPVGEFTTSLTTPDLIYAIEHGHVRECYGAAWYDTADLFSAFVNYFWKTRREFEESGDMLMARWCKAMMVALYGRFGAHTYNTRAEGSSIFPADGADWLGSLDGEEARWYYSLAGKMWTSGKSGLHREAFPAIMAHIAAYGRERMLHLVDLAGKDNVFVMLSDGLIVNTAGYERLLGEIQPDTIGMLKLKLTGEDLEVYSDVEYRLAAHSWRPGVQPSAVEVDDGVFIEYRDTNLAGLARSGDVSSYVRRKTKISLARKVRTGTVTDSGRIVPRQIHQSPPSRL